MVNVDIISGFLGSGKTSLIKHILKNTSEKLVVIENEFSEINIDSKVIKREGFDVVELQNGCICCTIKTNFEKSLMNVINEHKPNRIIIEPTGVGLLSEILSVFKNEDMKKYLRLNFVITMVDTKNFFEYIDNFGDFFKDQIQNAYLIVLSKLDMVDKDCEDKVRRALLDLNDKVDIIGFDEFCGNKFEIVDKIDIKNTSITQQMKKMKTITIQSNKTYKPYQLENILKEISKYKNIVRIKGFVKSIDKNLEINYINGDFQINECNQDVDTRVCIIGLDLNKNEITSIFDCEQKRYEYI